MFHVKQHKQIRDTNRLINNAKHKRIKQYYKELSDYIDDITKMSLDKITHDANTEDGETSCDGKLSDELGLKLLNPPKLGDLSLPGFLIEEKISDKNKSVLSSLEKSNEDKTDFEVIDLNRGYLYISVNYTKRTYHLAYHTNTAKLNKYLDMGKNIKTVTPTLLRDGAIVGTSAYGVQRIIDVIKSLVSLLVFKI